MPGTKHVELDLYFVRDEVVQDQLIVKHIPSADQITDILTKAISNNRFHTLWSEFKVHRLPTLSLMEDVKDDGMKWQRRMHGKESAWR